MVACRRCGSASIPRHVSEATFLALEVCAVKSATIREMRRDLLIRYLREHGIKFDDRLGDHESYVYAESSAVVPPDDEVDDLLVTAICRSLGVQLPPQLERKRRRSAGANRDTVIRVPSDAIVLVILPPPSRPGKGRGAKRARPRSSRV
jgi:hypothetical protein